MADDTRTMPVRMRTNSCSSRHLFFTPEIIEVADLASDLREWSSAPTPEDVTNARLGYLPAVADSELFLWPEVIEARPLTAKCFVDRSHPADISTLLGAPNTTQRWLDLCTEHASQVDALVRSRVG